MRACEPSSPRSRPLGAGLLFAAVAVAVSQGDGGEVRWLLLGPLPFLAIGKTSEQQSHRRVTAVLTLLRDAGLRG